MNILYITTSYERKADSATIRNNAWVNGLIELGCNVTVLTVDWPENLKSSFLVKNNKAKVERTKLNDFSFLRVTTSSYSRKLPKWITYLRHTARDIIYFPDVCRRWVRYLSYDISRFDVVISSSDLKSSHFVANKLLADCIIHRPYWIQVWGDPWYSDINIGLMHKLPAKYYERQFIKRADAIVYVSELTQKNMMKIYPQFAHKIYYIPRGYYMSALKKIECEKNVYSICYTGVLSKYRLKYIEPFLETVNIYNSKAEKKVCIHFYGNYDNEVINLIGEFESCIVHSSIDYEQILNLYSTSDALMFVPNGSDSTQIPGKIFDYMGTQLPIICLMDSLVSPLANILSKYSRCKVVEYNNRVDSIAMLENLVVNDVIAYDVDGNFAPVAIASKLLQIIR